MTVAMIHPVILCGGTGTRLWPDSRKMCPKPFLPLVSDETLFQQAVRRVAGDDRFAVPMVVAGAGHADLIAAQLGDVSGARLVIEPAAKNTAPAIALAAALARDDWLVSFGIAPDRPETGYGYLQRGEPLAGGFAIRRFVEKPDLATARGYLASGEYSWNGGIFAFRAGHLLAELAAHRPEMAQLVREAVAQGRADGIQFHPAAEPFAQIVGDSIEYAVMENTQHAAMVPADMGWSDIGNWAALADAADDAGNVKRGKVDLAVCRDVFATTDGPRISAVGLEGVCIVVSGGEILVTTCEGAQAVGKLPGASNQ